MNIIQDYVCLDIETTGTSIDSEIIELAAIKVKNGVIIDQFHELIKATTSIPQSITWLTGITDHDVAECRNISSVLLDFLEFIGDNVLVGHNIISFDYRIVSGYALQLFGLIMENECIDTLEMSRAIPLKNHTLARMCDYYGITNAQAHRAMSDVMATNELFIKLCNGERNDNYTEGYLPEKKLSYFPLRYNDQTTALRQLIGLLDDVLSDGKVDEEEVYIVRNWLNDNSNLKNNFPYSLINDEITAALNDGKLDTRELDRLCKVFLHAIDPVNNPLPNSDTCNCIEIYGKNVCLTGDFEHGTKNHVEEILSEKGATVNKNVTKKLDILIVGSFGSGSWGEGNYGNKIKKALEYQSKGLPIEIITETTLFTILEA